MHSEGWEKRAAEKRRSTWAKIPQAWLLDEAQLEEAKQQRDLTGPFIQQFLNPEETAIITKETIELVSLLSDGSLSAFQVAGAYCKTAAIAHQINNCLHEIFFDQALARASELDAFYAKHGKPTGPLHGLPISLKDQFHVKGVDTTMGYVGYIGCNMNVDHPALTHKVESQLTTELLSLGAVLYCKTSLPQTLLIGETKNNIIGETLNPRNTNLSCGGSSGGEGALIALGGSTLGFGTDIGGSVRIPAGFNGVFSLKPTPERLSYREVANTNPGQDTYRSTVGILGSSLSGIELGLRSVLSTEPWVRDPAVTPMPFREDVLTRYLSRATANGHAVDEGGRKPLKLGVLWTDGVVGLHPPIQRGIQMVVDALRKSGHKVVDWVPPSQSTAKRVHVSFLFADGAHDIHSHLALSGEPLIPDLRDTFQLRPPIDLLKYQGLTLEGIAYEQQYSDYWNSTAADDGQIVDAVIMPVAPHAAVIPGKFYHTAYTEAINLLNYSACVIPVTRADKTIDKIDESYLPLSPMDEKNYDAYDPEIYDGGPVGVQIVARKFEEEKVLAIGKIVCAALAEAKASESRN